MKDWKLTSTEKQNNVMQTYSVVDAPEHLISSSEPVIETHQGIISTNVLTDHVKYENNHQQRKCT